MIFASGLKYVGVGTTALGWILCLVALGGGAYWLYRVRPWENGRPADSATLGAGMARPRIRPRQRSPAGPARGACRPPG